MSWKKNLGYFMVGAATSAIGALGYVDHRFEQAEQKYQQQIQYQADEMRLEIEKAGENINLQIEEAGKQISSELEEKINKEIKNLKKQLGLPEWGEKD